MDPNKNCLRNLVVIISLFGAILNNSAALAREHKPDITQKSPAITNHKIIKPTAENQTTTESDTYFVATTISPLLLMPPLKLGDKSYQDQINYIINLQKSVEDWQIKQAQSQREMSPEMVASAVDNLTREKFLNVYKLLDKVGRTSRVVTDNAKNYWHTDRPYMVDKNIKPLIEAHSNKSYPSGHTSGSYTWAYVLALLYPEKADVFYKKAENIATNRILVGMHFPYDIEAGKRLSLLTVGALLQNAEFISDYSKAEKEIGSSAF